jgi:hypothetical protein
VAGRQHLNQLSAQVRDDALQTLQALLPSDADDGGREREALEAATRHVVARTDPEFQVNALIASLARIIAYQQQEIDTLKRAKANASALKEAKQK